jgi:quinol monooxygenase YgiN
MPLRFSYENARQLNPAKNSPEGGELMRYPATVAFGFMALSFAAAPVVAAEVELQDGTKLADKPYFIVTYVEAAPDATDAVATLLKEHAAASKDDDGNLRFEILQRGDRENHFAILEAWADPDARNAHASSEDTVKFRKDLQPHLYSPYDERPHVALDAADPASLAEGDLSTVYVLTHVDIIPPEQFAPCSRQVDESGPCGNEMVLSLVEDSRKHDGVMRFDVLTQANRPNHMTLVEAWSNAAAQNGHTVDTATRNFRDALAGIPPDSGVADDPLFVINPLTGSLYDEQLYSLVE